MISLFKECTEEPEEICEEVEMRIPKQEMEIKKKCLLPDDGAGVNAAITGTSEYSHIW